MAHSDATRQGIFDALAATARSENAKKGTSAGLREVAAVEVREEARYKKILMPPTRAQNKSANID